VVRGAAMLAAVAEMAAVSMVAAEATGGRAMVLKVGCRSQLLRQ